MKKLSIFASLVAFTLVSCKSSSTTTTSSTNNTEVKTEEVVKTSPKKGTTLRSRNLATE